MEIYNNYLLGDYVVHSLTFWHLDIFTSFDVEQTHSINYKAKTKNNTKTTTYKTDIKKKIKAKP